MTFYYCGEPPRSEPSVHAVPGTPAIGKKFWVRLRYDSGYETTYYEKTELNRRILIDVTRPYAVVVETGESE